MERIIKYNIQTFPTWHDLNTAVQQDIQNGWQPYGNIVVNLGGDLEHGHWTQVMVKTVHHTAE